MIFRMIAPKWAEEQKLLKFRAFEGKYSFEQMLKFNKQGYNCYYFPNYPSEKAYEAIPNKENGRKRSLIGSDIDTFEYCFVDLDMKDYQSDDPARRHEYKTKEEFVSVLLGNIMKPTAIVDSGGGIHAYYRVVDLDAMNFLRLNRRLCRKLNTDPEVSKLVQLMRVPGTMNTKIQRQYRPCEVIHEDPDAKYDSEGMSKLLPPITPEDETYCKEHYDRMYNVTDATVNIAAELPKIFHDLCRKNKRVHKLFYDTNEDRSTADFTLGHMLYGAGLSREDTLAVLVHTDKASERSRLHRYNYAMNIVTKVWEANEKKDKPKPATDMTIRCVNDILSTEDEDSKRIRFHCHPMIDGTDYGMRLGHVLGLIGGSGNGKTTTAMNMMAWFTVFNTQQDYVHVYWTGEMTEGEIAEIWQQMAPSLTKDYPGHDWGSKVFIVGNYNPDGTYREMGMEDIQEYVLAVEKKTGKKVGCVVMDHIGILKQEKGDSDFSGLIGNCQKMKAFAIATNTFLMMQSQTSRAKNGGGDIELDMDAAFGTSNFENYCDWVMTTWQPLKRVYPDMTDKSKMLTVLAYKLPKIRKKNVLLDNIRADATYGMFFDPTNGRLREMTEDEHTAFEYWNKRATTVRNKDKKREPAPLRSVTWTKAHSDALKKDKNVRTT